MYADSRSTRRQYTPLLGENREDSNSQSSTEDGYQTGRLPFSLNADPADLLKTATMSKENDGGMLSSRPVSFADQNLLINQPEISPAPSSFTDSFETSLKSVSDYSAFNDGHPDFSFVSTVRHIMCVIC